MTHSRRFKAFRRRSSRMIVVPLLLATIFASLDIRAESQHDALVFLSLEGNRMYSSQNPALDGSDHRATVDLLYSYNSDRFRFLAEFILSNTEGELERVKGAWRIDDRTLLWLGRFHAISNYWTTEYHHGQYMQTSISRPGLEEWEDESGPMPSHITGLSLESDFALGDKSGISLGLAAGLAPRFDGDQLVAFDVLDPESGHDVSLSGRLVYRPDILTMKQIGIAVAHNEIAVVSDSNPNLADLNAIRQSTIGIFSNWHWQDWRLSLNWVYFDIEMQYQDADVDDEFLLGYVQGEYEASEDWTVFGRVELGHNEDLSPYLQLLPSVIAHRHMIGVRWDFADSHGLTLELAETSTQGAALEHDNFKEIRVQWSAVFP